MATTYVRHYVEEKNPDGAHFPGVGLRDLTQEEWDAIPEAIQRDVDASGMYRKTKPQGWKDTTPAYESGVKSNKPVVDAVAVAGADEGDAAVLPVKPLPMVEEQHHHQQQQRQQQEEGGGE